MLVEGEADQQGHRIGGDQPVGVLGVGEVEAFGHAPTLARTGTAAVVLAPENADERTRTSTWFPRHGPEPCASTNSATSACREKAKISHRPEAESIGHEGGHHVG